MYIFNQTKLIKKNISFAYIRNVFIRNKFHEYQSFRWNAFSNTHKQKETFSIIFIWAFSVLALLKDTKQAFPQNSPIQWNSNHCLLPLLCACNSHEKKLDSLLYLRIAESGVTGRNLFFRSWLLGILQRSTFNVCPDYVHRKTLPKRP